MRHRLVGVAPAITEIILIIITVIATVIAGYIMLNYYRATTSEPYQLSASARIVMYTDVDGKVDIFVTCSGKTCKEISITSIELYEVVEPGSTEQTQIGTIDISLYLKEGTTSLSVPFTLINKDALGVTVKIVFNSPDGTFSRYVSCPLR